MLEAVASKTIDLSLPPLFSNFDNLLLSFLNNNRGKIVDASTDENEIKGLANQLIKLMSYLSSEIEKAVPRDLFRKVISSRQVYRTIHKHDNGEEIRYHVVHKTPSKDISMNDLLIINQRLPSGVDTLEEVHKQGMEIYLPLTEGTVFFVNSQVYDPKPLEALILVLPGDVHRHIRRNGAQPARVLIMGAFGFSRGEKVEPHYSTPRSFPSINRYIRIK
jgi:hypothetical protein